MEFIHDYKAKYLQYAKKQMQHNEPVGLYGPIKFALNAQGKGIRPVLTLMGCHMYKKEYETALPAAFAVEVFHNFTLLHDDIMDKAELRRGKPSVYKKYGVPSAILSGDAMLIYSYKYLNNFPELEISQALTKTFTEVAIGVCEGQQYDMDFEIQDAVSIDEYIKMITQKTSILLGASLQMGAIIAEAEQESQKHLFEFGKYIGIAFQIQDDILDVFGEEEIIGKVNAGDIINNKKTYLYLKALELADTEEKRILVEEYQRQDFDPENKIAKVKKIFTSLAVEEYANQLKEAYMDLGISHLNACKGNIEVKEKLIKLSKFLIHRDQ